MGIKADFNFKDFEQFLFSMPDIIGEEIFQALSYLGEECVKRIRDRTKDESWEDQTGNLRSSIGYAVYEHGKTMIESAFEQIKQGSQGVNEGKKMVADLASKYAETYALVIVAGMNYADFVEAMKNKDVLASTELWARGQVDARLKGALDRAQKRISKLQHDLGL